MNGAAIRDVEAEIAAHPHTDGRYVIVRKGKKNYFLLEVKA